MNLSSLQTLCEDLLYRIFLNALPIVLLCDRCPEDITTIEPMNFSMVCRSWRAVVRAHSNLWGRLWISGYSDGPLKPSLDRFLSKWLQYSETSPLSLTLSLRNRGDESDAVTRAIIDTALAQQSRLEVFNVWLDDPSIQFPFTLQFSPTLSSLHFGLSDFYFNHRGSEDPAAFLDFTSCAVSTKLQTLIVRDNVRWVLPKLPSPALCLPNLYKLEICSDLNNNVDDFKAVLLGCPNVISLSIWARLRAPSASHNTADNKSVLLPHTTDLLIASENRIATVQLLNALTCPSLRKLYVDVSTCGVDSNDPQEHCMSLDLLNAHQEFFARSRPPILSITFSFGSLPRSQTGHGSALRDILRPLRSLEELILLGVVVDSKLFEDMSFNDEGGSDYAIMPLLTTIRIFYSSRVDAPTFHVEQKAVDDMIASRQRSSTHSWKKLTLEIPGYSSPT